MYLNWDSALHFHPTSLLPATKGIPVPVYGNYGGPGNSGPGAPVDLLDAAFQAHDQAYATAGTTAERSEADAILIGQIQALDSAGQLQDPEASLYAGFATLAIMGQMAANDSLGLLGGPQVIGAVAFNAIDNMESGLAAEPAEGRSLHGALHVFEARFVDSFFPLL